MKHHIHKIKKTHNGLNLMVTFVAIAEPLMTLPQVLKVWSTKQAGDLSLLSWSFYLFAAVIWLLYGLTIKNRPIILASALWVIFDAMVVVGIILYG